MRGDTFLDEVARDNDRFGDDIIVNALEAKSGVTLTGEVELGYAVAVDGLGHSNNVVVAANGGRSLDIPVAHIHLAVQTYDMTVTAADSARNDVHRRDADDLRDWP